MKTIAPRQDQGIPGVYGLLLLDVISRWGYNNESLFQPFGLTSEQLADPDFRIPPPCRQRTGEIRAETDRGTDLGLSSRHTDADLDSWLYRLCDYDGE